MERRVTLESTIVARGDIVAKSGLHIGGAGGALEIGGVDSPVIRDPLSNRPYIPGSSLRGKMRSLSEQLHGLEQNFAINRRRGAEVWIHTCQAVGGAPSNDGEYENWKSAFASRFSQCPVCSVFGVTGDQPAPHPTSLVVRDVHLGDESAKLLEAAKTDLPFSEIKWEATIDRVTSAATPRQIERVPAGAVFDDFELVFSVYRGMYEVSNRDGFGRVLAAMKLVEESYLGGLGSRGSGRVEFRLRDVYVRNHPSDPQHSSLLPGLDGKGARLTDELINDIKQWVGSVLPKPEKEADAAVGESSDTNASGTNSPGTSADAAQG